MANLYSSSSIVWLKHGDEYKPQQGPFHHTKKKKSRPATNAQRCLECGTDTTPEWRKGPSGTHTLCNACGLRHSKRLRREVLDAIDKVADENTKESVHHRMSIAFLLSSPPPSSSSRMVTI